MPQGMVVMFVAPKFVVPLSLSGCGHQWEGPPEPPKKSLLVRSFLSIPPVRTGSCHWFVSPQVQFLLSSG